MLSLGYYTGIRTYGLGVAIARFLGNEKAKKWVDGRKNWKSELKKFRASNQQQPLIWFHVSSLGEFEQVKPLIEKVKQDPDYINHIIFVSFFSPSGYEYSLDYELADKVFYLPLDTQSNASYFIETLEPEIAIFVKYDFWFNYLNTLQLSQVPIVYFSCNFRPNQIYFKSYAKWQLSILEDIDRIYTLNQSSREVLSKYNFKHVEVCGDTRYDKVIQNAERKSPIPIIEKFKGDSPLMILGSSWQPEEKIIGKYLTENHNDLKVIIAPHDISEKHLLEIEQIITVPMRRYSQLTPNNVTEAKVILIDNIGLLSNTYQYADYAFVGGGFTNDLHNILEAAAFGNAVFYGDKHSKYPEGQELVDFGGGVSVRSYEDFEQRFNELLEDHQRLNGYQNKAREFVYQHKGATAIVFKAIKELL
ncbi:MAG: hypothetical protein N4A35_12100 [Flavobacteriales bacterium]|jgi:3-deoxy-D-manno-octulosonic-acid transferase|nr:hypothetical protein [Flavobacteriales bacterium]